MANSCEMIIDTHAHLQFPEFTSDIEEVLRRAAKNGVGKIINVGCNIEACDRGLTLIDLYDDPKGEKELGVELFATLGLHPYDAEFLTDDLLKSWEEKIKKYNEVVTSGAKKIVAIGEVGLDYFKAQVSREIQQDAFKKQIEFAQQMDLPIVVHNREADEDTLKILQGSGAKKVVFHCYGSSLDFAREVWANGFYTSFTGIITYPNAAELREVVVQCPDDRWMVETDCPYLAPQGFRGQRNEPSYVKEVLEKVAEVKEMKFKEVEELQKANAGLFYSV